jgi:hypothetical protein
LHPLAAIAEPLYGLDSHNIRTDISSTNCLQAVAQRGLRKGELSKFVERAVPKEVLAQTTAALKARTQDVPYARLQSIIDESIDRVRGEGSSRRRRR